MVLSLEEYGVEYLDFVSAALHDLWFHVGEVREDEGRLVVPVYAGEERGRWTHFAAAPRPGAPQGVRGALEIFGLTGWHLQESQGVGTYDVNRLRYHATTQRLEIMTGVPVDFWAGVSEIHLRVTLDRPGATEASGADGP